MKWVLVAVAFVLGAAITWLLTVKRVTQTVPAEGADLAGADEGGSGMASAESQDVQGSAGEGGTEADAVDDGSDDASRFGGERTSATASPRVGWDHDAEDIDALLSDEEKAGDEEPSGEVRSGKKPSDDEPTDEESTERKPEDV